MLIGDYISIDVLMNDLEQIYSNQQIVPLKINYRDYITYTQHQREDINFLNKFYEDKAYWKIKLIFCRVNRKYIHLLILLIQNQKHFSKEIYFEYQQMGKVRRKMPEISYYTNCDDVIAILFNIKTMVKK